MKTIAKVLKRLWPGAVSAGAVSLVLSLGAQDLPEPGGGGEPYVNFSFDQVEIRLIAKLAGEITGKRFVVDDNVTGKVTVVTPERVTTSEVFPLFLSILESSGYSVMERDNTYHVVALPETTVPVGPTAVMRVPITATSPRSITSSPFIVITRAPVRRNRPSGRSRSTATRTLTSDGW